MTRPRPAHFVGASGLSLDPAAGLTLAADPRVGLLLKADGAYCQLTTDSRGRIDSAISSTGAPLAGTADLLGIYAAPPYSTLVGEAMVHSEAGIAATASLGFVQVHLFDCLRLAGQPLAPLPYSERHGALYRAQSWCESEGHGRARDWTLDGHGNAHVSTALHDDPRTPTKRPARRPFLDRAPSRRGQFVAAIPRDLRRFPVLPIVRGLADARALWDLIESTGLEGAVAVRLDARAGAPRAKRKIKITDTISASVLAADASHSRVSAIVRRRPLEFTVPGRHEGIVEIAHNGFYRSGLPRFARVVRRRCDKMIGAVPDRGALIEWRA